MTSSAVEERFAPAALDPTYGCRRSRKIAAAKAKICRNAQRQP